jgi:hypothetical protein
LTFILSLSLSQQHPAHLLTLSTFVSSK